MFDILFALFAAIIIAGIEFLHDFGALTVVISFVISFLIFFVSLYLLGWRRLAYIFFITIITCAALEIGLRSFDRNNLLTFTGKKEWLLDSYNKRALLCYPSNPAGYFNIDLRDPKTREAYGIKDNIWEDSPFCIEEKYNPFGYRDRESDFKNNKPKIAFLGDSFTKGSGVRAEDRFSDILTNYYHWGDRVDVYNLGVSGAGVSDVYRRDFKGALHISVDIILYCYTLNDPILSREMEQKQQYINDLMNIRYDKSDLSKFFDSAIKRYNNTSLKKQLFEKEKKNVLNSRLLFVLHKLFLDRLITGQTINWYKDMYTPKNPGWEETKETILKMRDESKNKNIFFAVIVLPLFYDFNHYPFVDIHDKIMRFCRENDIYALDTMDCFIGSNYKDYIVHPLDYHPNSKAHKKIAAKINTFIERKINGVLEQTK